MPRDIGEFLNTVMGWAASRKDILSVALVGSLARGTATNASDVDLVMIVEEPELYFEDDRWLHQFGCVSRRSVEDWGMLRCRRVLYADGLEVEFGITSDKWARIPMDSGTNSVVRDGMRVLVDKQGVLDLLVRSIEADTGDAPR